MTNKIMQEKVEHNNSFVKPLNYPAMTTTLLIKNNNGLEKYIIDTFADKKVLRIENKSGLYDSLTDNYYSTVIFKEENQSDKDYPIRYKQLDLKRDNLYPEALTTHFNAVLSLKEGKTQS